MDKITQQAAERAAEYEYHKFIDMGATLEDSINAAAEAYKAVAGEEMENPIEFFGYTEEDYEDLKNC